METQEKRHRYFAFVSYSHKGDTSLAVRLRNTFPQSTLFTRDDMRWAIWLQKSLERYRLPAVISKKFDIDPARRIKPVFRDEVELGCGILHEELYRNLDDSNYLLVLCSPNSARPNKDGVNYIDREVRHFIEKNGTGRVIPVIIDGIPNDPGHECFPPVIKEHGFIALDATKSSREHVLSNIVAKMLNLNPDELWERERRRLRRSRMQRTAVFSLLIALAAFAGYWTWDWNRDYVEYYADYVDKWGMPTGIFPLAEGSLGERHAHYRFIYRGRKSLFGERVLHEVMCSNSAGYYLESDKTTKQFSERLIRQQLEYNDDFALDSIKIVDRNGTVLEQRNFSGKNMTCIDFTVLDNDGVNIGKMQKASGFGFSSGDMFQSKAEISRWRLKRDKNGFLVEIRFCKDTFDSPAKNADGIYGRRLELDQYGRRIKAHYLDHNGKTMQLRNGISSVRYDYQKSGSGLLGVAWLDVFGTVVKEYRFVLDKNQNISERTFHLAGRPAYEDGYFKEKRVYLNGFNVETTCFGVDGKPCLNKNGVARFTCRYDERGKLVEKAFFDAEGKPCLHKEGPVSVSDTYDERGNLIEVSYFGIDGKRCLSRDGYATFTCQYNERGKVVEVACFGIDGKPCLNKKGVATFTNTYDERGNLVEVAYFGVDGKPCLDLNGCAKVTYQYDERGNLVEEAYFGIDGKPCLHKEGSAALTRRYDDRGNLVEEAFFGVDGKPCLTRAGYARGIVRYDEFGNNVETAFFGIDGKSCLVQEGYARLTRRYDERGNPVEEAFFGVDGKPCLTNEGYAKGVVRYDERGNCIEVAYYGVDGKPCLNKDGYGMFTAAYDARGNLIEQAYFGVDGKPCPHKDGHARFTRLYDERGNCVEVSYFGVDGKPCLHKDGHARFTRLYDERGNCVEVSYFGVDGKPCQTREGYAKCASTYDERDNLVGEAYFDVDGKPSLVSDGYAAFSSRYDERGNLVETAFFGVDGHPCLHKDGNAKVTRRYDERGNSIEVAYFGVDGKPCLSQDGYAKCTVRYDERGNNIETAFFDMAGRPCLLQIGYSRVTCKYDERGNIIERAYFDVDGQPCLHQDGYAKVTDAYDERGNPVEEAFFGIDGKPCLGKKGCAKGIAQYDERGNCIEIILRGVHDEVLLHRRKLVFVAEVPAGGAAAARGVHVGDQVLDFAGEDWSMGNGDITTGIQRVRNTEKQLIFARRNPDGTFTVFSRTFSVGLLGMHLVDNWADIKDYDKIMAAYKTFQAENAR